MIPSGLDPSRGPQGVASADAERDALRLLHEAERIVTIEYGSDDRLTSGARHMIRSVADMVAALSAGDLEAARAALGHARAAVAAAAYTVRVLHDDLRTGP